MCETEWGIFITPDWLYGVQGVNYSMILWMCSNSVFRKLVSMATIATEKIGGGKEPSDLEASISINQQRVLLDIQLFFQSQSSVLEVSKLVLRVLGFDLEASNRSL